MSRVPPELEQPLFPATMSFRGEWRAYQSRLLAGLNTYLEDRRVHIVAAPGSGKTILGLEIARRVNEQTLVLAPTLTIRDQWAQRLCEQFLPPGVARPDWISTDIRAPRLLTIATYQALHALCTGQAEPAETEPVEDENGSSQDSATLNGNSHENGDEACGPSNGLELPPSLANFKTLVVDEAHHLRAEWWKSLNLLSARLQPCVIALTATPPYDVSLYEWQRYQELCGPVDAEISIPELVVTGDLSPHQDYVCFSAPAPEEQNSLLEFKASVDAFQNRLLENSEFSAALAAHPWLTSPDAHLEEILNRPEYLSSILVFLQAAGAPPPRKALHALGVGSKSIPRLNLEWLEILLTRCLYEDEEHFTGNATLFRDLRHELLQMGAIERRKVVLRDPPSQARLLTTSRTKLGSIENIVRIESSAVGQALRCVVLTDFIRKSDLPKSPGLAPDGPPQFEDIGAVPVFETLRRASIPGLRLGVLCGSLVIVPESCRTALFRTAAAIGIEPADLLLRPMPHATGYSFLEISGTYRHGSVRLITSLFEQGELTVLVGTKSLLGEGWDAPAVNTLILASYVGSYVTSNQMRGRCLRIDPACPAKTANVWHLVCVAPDNFGPGDDYALLTRRFDAFACVGADSTKIENGIARLGLGDPPFSGQRISDLNAQTSARAIDREAVRRNWQQALAMGSVCQMADGLKAQPAALPRGFVFRNTIAALAIEGGSLFVSIFFGLLRIFGRVRTGQDPLLLTAEIGGVAAAVSLPWALTALWRLVRHGTPERSMKQIAAVLLEALRSEGSIGNSSAFEIHTERNSDGSVYCWISGGNGREQAIAMRSLREVLSPLENPRYLLATSRFLRFFREDYFPVPEVLGRKKEFAEAFADQWRRRVGPVQLIHTRSPEGRRILLRARLHSLSATFQPRAERLSCWK